MISYEVLEKVLKEKGISKTDCKGRKTFKT